MPRTPSPRRPRRRTQVGTRRQRRQRRQRRGTMVRSRRQTRSPEYPGVSPEYDYGGLVPYDRDYRPEPRMRTPSPMPDLSDEELMRQAGYDEETINEMMRGSKKKTNKKKKKKGKKSNKKKVKKGKKSKMGGRKKTIRQMGGSMVGPSKTPRPNAITRRAKQNLGWVAQDPMASPPLEAPPLIIQPSFTDTPKVEVDDGAR